jgi:hypothetical protein
MRQACRLDTGASMSVFAAARRPVWVAGRVDTSVRRLSEDVRRNGNTARKSGKPWQKTSKF